MKKTFTILITGGEGYIGSHIQEYFRREVHTLPPFRLISIDTKVGATYQIDLKNKDALRKIFILEQPDVVMHLAALTSVPESVQRPIHYYNENIFNTTLPLLQIMNEITPQAKLIYASSAAALTPEANVYGHTKKMAEEIIAHVKPKNSVSLRLFNVAPGKHGQHFLRILAHNAINNEETTLFGDCIRDYVHVWDVAAAFAAVAFNFDARNSSYIFNIAGGDADHQRSTKELASLMEQEFNGTLKIINGAERAGDPKILVSTKNKEVRQSLHWAPRYSMTFILRDALLEEAMWEEEILCQTLKNSTSEVN